MPSVIFEILIVLVLVVANGVFAMSEMAVVSSRKARLQQMAGEGNTGARVAVELADAPNRFLSTVQIGITLIGIFAGAYGGATIAGTLAPQLARVSWLAAYSEALAFVLVVGTITYLSLVLGELLPKRLALSNPERIAARIAVPMSVLSRVAAPLVKLLSLSTDLALKALGVKPSAALAVTEEEIRLLIEQGTETGAIAHSEQDLLERVFSFGDRQVAALMTPRPDIVWLDLKDSEAENRRKLAAFHHSQFPVCLGELDKFLGVVRVKDLFERLLAARPLTLEEALLQPLVVPETAPALVVLEQFKKSGIHMALVVDEFGGVQGLVTLTDILEALVGDLPVDGTTDEAQAVRREDGSWLVDGSLSLDELEHLVEPLPELPRVGYRTVGGLVMAQLGRIPKATDHFNLGPCRFEVVDMDGNRVDRVLITTLGAGAERDSPP
ncbi:hemolysin family protein [Gloeobacter violaceus]|uniref:Glr0381 protein n=1 Tax=Gloeobacter violaceus (strain ATCC 29082 / PCC 7421) TaxID=251221 RepID=Q7NNN0_GLOVI|nr:hemolysin family protein [Gloeobacter violaceus]BAC88322.1 glr0381 [Gloeobacter violaceus PCC 7421]